MKTAIAFATLLLVGFSSCKQPVACFRVEEDTNNIRVNTPVHFTSFCSENAGEFFWEFSDKPDSVIFTEYVTWVFRDTGNFVVKLSVGSGQKTAYTSLSLNVKP